MSKNLPTNILKAAKSNLKNSKDKKRARKAFPFVARKAGKVDWDVTQTQGFLDAVERGVTKYSTKNGSYSVVSFDEAMRDTSTPLCDPWDRTLASDSRLGSLILKIGPDGMRVVALAIVIMPDVFGSLSFIEKMGLLGKVKKAKKDAASIDLFGIIEDELNEPTPAQTRAADILMYDAVSSTQAAQTQTSTRATGNRGLLQPLEKKLASMLGTQRLGVMNALDMPYGMRPADALSGAAAASVIVQWVNDAGKLKAAMLPVAPHLFQPAERIPVHPVPEYLHWRELEDLLGNVFGNINDLKRFLNADDWSRPVVNRVFFSGAPSTVIADVVTQLRAGNAVDMVFFNNLLEYAPGHTDIKIVARGWQ